MPWAASIGHIDRVVPTSLPTGLSTIVPNCRACLNVSKYSCQVNQNSGRLRI